MSDDTTTPAPAAEPNDNVPAIYGAICELMTAVDHVGKEQTNKKQGFQYRGIDDVLNTVGPEMRKHCVFATTRLVSIERTLTTSQAGNGLMNTIVQVEFDFVAGADGSKITVGPIPGEAMDSGDKSTAKAMSVAYRIALIQLLAIPTGDPDPDQDVYERATAPAPAAHNSNSARGRARTDEADPWANSNPNLVKFYGDAIAAADTADGVKAIWPEIVADVRSSKLAEVDGNELKFKMQSRIAAIAQDVAAEAGQ